jgi:hypothetical protein
VRLLHLRALLARAAQAHRQQRGGQSRQAVVAIVIMTSADPRRSASVPSW